MTPKKILFVGALAVMLFFSPKDISLTQALLPEEKIAGTEYVIEYQGKYLPIKELIIDRNQTCPVPHWREGGDSVIATDGTILRLQDDVICGFGKTTDRLILELK